ncbi:MAG: ferrous iron transport protein A [Euryarchaeota archaeon]|nr:ferrous iron transport protein A [Euryarchaeota archaeon]
MTSLVELEVGKKALIKKLRGGHILKRQLESLNIRVGKKVKKISSAPFHGPVVVDVEGCKIAIGRGMAANVLVEVIDENSPYG